MTHFLLKVAEWEQAFNDSDSDWGETMKCDKKTDGFKQGQTDVKVEKVM